MEQIKQSHHPRHCGFNGFELHLQGRGAPSVGTQRCARAGSQNAYAVSWLLLPIPHRQWQVHYPTGAVQHHRDVSPRARTPRTSTAAGSVCWTLRKQFWTGSSQPRPRWAMGATSIHSTPRMQQPCSRICEERHALRPLLQQLDMAHRRPNGRHRMGAGQPNQLERLAMDRRQAIAILAGGGSM